MPGEVTDGARAVRPLDGIDAEFQELPAMQDLAVDDALAKIGPGVVLRGRRLLGGSTVAQAATVAGALAMVSPVSRSNR
jgi:hypothetical protein